MIAKTSIGKSFGSALEYGAALKEGKEKKLAELLGASNIGARDPQGMAAEMIAVADSSRCQSPVWHTSLNWPKGEEVQKEQLLRAASEYCRQIGADPTRHQVAMGFFFQTCGFTRYQTKCLVYLSDLEAADGGWSQGRLS